MFLKSEVNSMKDELIFVYFELTSYTSPIGEGLIIMNKGSDESFIPELD